MSTSRLIVPLAALLGCTAPPGAPPALARLRLDAAEIPRAGCALSALLPGIDPAAGPLAVGDALAFLEPATGGALASWIEPEVPAEGLVRDVRAAGPGVTPTFRATRSDDGAALWFGGHLVLQHVARFDPGRFDDTSKPYYQLHVPGLAEPVTKGLGGQYPHHRGLFLGWNRTVVGGQRLDFWHCRAGAFQRDVAGAAELQARGPVLARWRTQTEWVAPGERAVVLDTRELTVWRPDGCRQQIDLTLTLSATTAPVRLESDPHHSGVHVRLAREVEQSLATMLHARTAVDQGDDVWRGGDAAAARFNCQGTPCAVVLLAGEELPAGRRWSTRPYGRLGVSWDAALAPGTPVTVRCRLLLLWAAAATAVDADWLEREARGFCTPVRVTVVPGNR